MSNPAGGYPASFVAGQPMLTFVPYRTLLEATQRPSLLGSPCSLSTHSEPCWRLPSVLSCWAAHAHCQPIANPAPMSAASDDHVPKTRRQLTAPIWVLFHKRRSCRPQLSTERTALRRPLLSLSRSLDVFSSRTPRLSSSRHAPRPRKTGRLTAAFPLAPS